MICPICKAEGQTSTVTAGAGISTAMYCPPFCDENGRYHDHDRNVSEAMCRCSRGHTFTSVRYNSCWCGWTNMPVAPDPV